MTHVEHSGHGGGVRAEAASATSGDIEKGRAPRVEVMDDPGLDAAAHEAALRGLARINAWSGVAATLWQALRPIAAAKRSAVGERFTALRVLDVACGGGDVAAALNARAQRHAKQGEAPMVVDGCDVSGQALVVARQRAERAARGSGQCTPQRSDRPRPSAAEPVFFEWDALSGTMPRVSGSTEPGASGYGRGDLHAVSSSLDHR